MQKDEANKKRQKLPRKQYILAKSPDSVFQGRTHSLSPPKLLRSELSSLKKFIRDNYDSGALIDFAQHSSQQEKQKLLRTMDQEQLVRAFGNRMTLWKHLADKLITDKDNKYTHYCRLRARINKQQREDRLKKEKMAKIRRDELNQQKNSLKKTQATMSQSSIQQSLELQKRIRQTEEEFLHHLYHVTENMINYAEKQDRQGNMGYIAKKVITKTGKGMFKAIKSHFYGAKDPDYEQLQAWHNVHRCSNETKEHLKPEITRGSARTRAQETLRQKLAGFLEHQAKAVEDDQKQKFYAGDDNTPPEGMQKLEFDMTEYDCWSKEILKIFKSRVSFICGKKYHEVSTFLCNLATLDKFRQDMQEN